MGYVKSRIPDKVFHLTKRKNVETILQEEKIRRFDDTECWFCQSVPDLLRYMEYTVLCKGKVYYKTDGSIGRYPRFKPEDYAVLELVPRYREGNWYKWNQELPPNSPGELMAQAKEFSNLKIGFRGDLRFKDCKVLEIKDLLDYSPIPDMTLNL